MFEDLVFKVADGREQALALELRRVIYEQELGPVGFDPFDEVGVHLVACDTFGDVVAAFRFLGPEHRPYDFEKHFELATFLPAGRSAGFLNRMCIRRDHRAVTRSSQVHLGLLKLSHDFALKRGVTDYFMYTFTHLLRFYRGVFFDSLNLSFEHEVWGEVHLMHQDVLGLPERCSKGRPSLARVLFHGAHPNFLI